MFKKKNQHHYDDKAFIMRKIQNIDNKSFIHEPVPWQKGNYGIIKGDTGKRKIVSGKTFTGNDIMTDPLDKKAVEQTKSCLRGWCGGKRRKKRRKTRRKSRRKSRRKTRRKTKRRKSRRKKRRKSKK